MTLKTHVLLASLLGGFVLAGCGGGKTTPPPTPPPSNSAPTAVITVSQATLEEGELVTLSGANSTDPEGGSLSYSWSQISGPAQNFDNTVVSFDLKSSDVDTDSVVEFELTVSDGSLSSVTSASFTIENIVQTPAYQGKSTTDVATLTASGPVLTLFANQTRVGYPAAATDDSVFVLVADMANPDQATLRALYPNVDGDILLSDAGIVASDLLDADTILADFNPQTHGAVKTDDVILLVNPDAGELIVSARVPNGPFQVIGNAAVQNICNVIGELSPTLSPDSLLPLQSRRLYFVAALSNGGASLYSVAPGYGVDTADLGASNPDIQFEADLAPGRDLCGPTAYNLTGADFGRQNGLHVVERNTARVRWYRQTGTTVANYDLTPAGQNFILNSTAGVELVTAEFLVDSPNDVNFDASLVAIFADSVRRGAHQIIVADADDANIAQQSESWALGAPSDILITSRLSRTPVVERLDPSTLPLGSVPALVADPYLEPREAFIVSPDSPDLTVFELGDAGWQFADPGCNPAMQVCAGGANRNVAHSGLKGAEYQAATLGMTSIAGLRVRGTASRQLKNYLFLLSPEKNAIIIREIND